MRTEEVAEKFRNRPGYNLVAYREVALPIWRINLRALIADEQPIGPFEEFTSRAIAEGFTSPDSIAALLGIDEQTAVNAAATLMVQDWIAHRVGDGGQTELALTPKGEKQLAEAVSIVPTEHHVTIEFDAVKWQLVPSGDWHLKPKDVRDGGLIEIPRARKKAPEIEDFKIEDVDSIIKAGEQRSRARGTVLALKTIEWRERVFREAVALIFRGDTPDDIHVDFALGGVLDEAIAEHVRHENLFARIGIDPRKGISDIAVDLESDLTADGVESAKRLTRTILATASKNPESEAATQTDPAEISHDDAEAATSGTEPPDTAQDDVDPTGPSIPEPPAVEMLSCYDHPKILRDAIDSANERLMIISPWVKRLVVNNEMVQALENCLDRGVNVYIGWGIAKLSEADEDIDHGVRKSFEWLASQYPDHFHPKRLGGTHAKVLVCDDKFVVNTSFNWLSFKGDRRRTARDERGMLLRTPAEIDSLFAEYHRRFSGRPQRL